MLNVLFILPAFQIVPGKPPKALPEKLHFESINIDEAPIALLIPSINGYGLCALAIVQKLCDVHNNFVQEYCQLTGETK